MKTHKLHTALLTLSLTPILWTFLGQILVFVSCENTESLLNGLSSILLIYLSGLSIALLLTRIYLGKLKRIVERQDKIIITEPKPSGSIITETHDAYLAPSENKPGSESNTLQPPFRPDESCCRKFSILIADDNSINRLLLLKQLEPYDFLVTEARDGNEAFNALVENRFDLVLLDLKMPGYSGHELIKIIRSHDSLNLDTPVVAITAHAQQNQLHEIIAEGFDECLIKPVLREQLEESLNLWLPKSQISTKQPVYADQLLARTHNDRILACSLLTKLCEELPRQSVQAQDLFKKKEFHEARSIIHTLHGSVSFCGLEELREVARKIENALLNNDHEGIDNDFEQLNTQVQKLLDARTETLQVINGERSTNCR